MSRPENRRRFFISTESTQIEVTAEDLRLKEGGGVFVFNSVDEFNAFVNRLGILAVKLAQELNPPPDESNNPDGSETPPA